MSKNQKNPNNLSYKQLRARIVELDSSIADVKKQRNFTILLLIISVILGVLNVR